MWVQTGATGGYHFSRHILAAQIRMMYQKSIDTGFHFCQIFIVRRPLVTAPRSIGCIITRRRASPEINILRKHLAHIGSTYHFTIEGCHLCISPVGTGELCKYPQDKDIEQREKQAKCNCYFK